MAGASLTSTSVDVSQASSSKLLWDEEEIMFEDISKPLKGKGKEKDVGKRRAYVRVVTSLGGASLNLELYCEKAPKTCYNFLMLARAGRYNDCLFHRLVPGFMVRRIYPGFLNLLIPSFSKIQAGDPTGTGSGGESYWGTPFRDEHDMKGAARHESRGVLAMANKGANTNGFSTLAYFAISFLTPCRSQFYLTFKSTPHLDKKHTVFGKLVGGDDVLDALENLPVKPGTDRPAKSVRITEVIIYQDPFDEYKKRLAKKLAKRAEKDNAGGLSVEEKKTDDVNWFGVKIGSENSVPNGGGSNSGGIGKYLNSKRLYERSTAGEESKKKRKLGFGDFEGW